MRGASLKLGGVAAAVATAMLLAGAVAPATAGSGKAPNVVWAEYGNDPNNASNYLLRAGTKRAESVVVKFRESPEEGEVTGPTETLNLTKDSGQSSPVEWSGTTSRSRPAPCYRLVYLARNAHGKSSRAYRLCAFGHGSGDNTRAPALKRW